MERQCGAPVHPRRFCQQTRSFLVLQFSSMGCNMTDEECISLIIRQEAELAITALDEEVAFAIGSAIRAQAASAALKVVIDIRTWDRQLFLAGTPGVNADNAEWVRRKSNAVRRWQKSSLRQFLERGRNNIPPQQTGADSRDFIMAGGSFPLRVGGAGIVGALTVSGLTGWEDHYLAVWGLIEHKGLDQDALQLPPE